MIRVLFCTENNVPLFDNEERYSVTTCKPVHATKYVSDIRPHVIISEGNVEDNTHLDSLSFDMRKRWIHFASLEDVDNLSGCIDHVYITNAIGRDVEVPFISVITPLYHTGTKIMDVYRSLRSQSFDNWEWIVYDNTPYHTSAAYDLLKETARYDPRVRLFTGSAVGVGEAKRLAFGLGTGQILVELDHDDYLTSGCLESIIEAYNKFPEAAFYYTDCAEVDGISGNSLEYPDGWGLGYGSYRDEDYAGRSYRVMNYPPVNRTTLSHIVGVPNHVRAWRKDFYHAIGGHNKELFVADDYELLLRTFLSTRMVHIKRFGYIQNIFPDGSNTQERSRSEIQRLVSWISESYRDRVAARLEELGIEGDDTASLEME